MIRECSVSVHRNITFDKVNIDHNQRKEGCYGNNVDPSKIGLNYQWEGNQSLEEFYDKTFQEEYEAQLQKNVKNGKASRNKGKETTYLEQLKKEYYQSQDEKKALEQSGSKKIDAKQKTKNVAQPCYEMILTFGNRDGIFGTTNGTLDDLKLSKDLMVEFIKDFETKYPSMKLVSASVHCDEVGSDNLGSTIHGHLDFVPVATSYKQGMKTRNSISKALAEMGYTDKRIAQGDDEFALGITQWQNEIRDYFETKLKEHGIDIVHGEECQQKHEDTPDYQKRRAFEREQAHKQEISKEFDKVYDDTVELLGTGKQGMLDAVKEFETNTLKAFEETTKSFYDDVVPGELLSNIEIIDKKDGLFGKPKQYALVPLEEYQRLNKVSYNNPDKLKKELNGIISTAKKQLESLVSYAYGAIDLIFDRSKLKDIKKSYERKVAQLKTKHQTELDAKDKEIRDLQKQVDNAKESAASFDALMTGIEQHPDRAFAESLINDMQIMYEWQTDQEQQKAQEPKHKAQSRDDEIR